MRACVCAPPQALAHPELAASRDANGATASVTAEAGAGSVAAGEAKPSSKPSEMRPLMTRALGEALDESPRTLYVGEDVEHGGYYRVTEGLVKRYGKRRVFDWPPDEASLVGAGIGIAQAGLLPIVEVPYAAYLSCGYNQVIRHYVALVIDHCLG